jgi:hypothetical protein
MGRYSLSLHHDPSYNLRSHRSGEIMQQQASASAETEQRQQKLTDALRFHHQLGGRALLI